MNDERQRKRIWLRATAVIVFAALAVWQFYVFVTFKSATGALEVQGGRMHLWLAISFGVIAFIVAFFVLSKSLQYDRSKEIHITSPPWR